MNRRDIAWGMIKGGLSAIAEARKLIDEDQTAPMPDIDAETASFAKDLLVAASTRAISALSVLATNETKHAVNLRAAHARIGA